ncbi:hypothetical protein V9T40_001860 [Parthenolecanium corni]|uniref:Ion transport domain-containing protein n=1 Tax=Parthenolecanium corni TaxID=536013 RepID=A0AAN9TTG7_9HEMI
MTKLDTFQRTDSLCYTSPQTALLISLKNESVDEFENILKRNFGKSIDVNYVYEDPENKTLLDIACSSKNKFKFVELLLKYGANINLQNTILKKAPIHLAVLYADSDTLKLLVEHHNIDINQPDRAGDTALHLATQQQKEDFVKLLLKHPDVEINKTNKKNQTALHIAVGKNNRQITELLVHNSDIDLDSIKDFTNQTCRAMISGKYPDLPLKDLGKPAKSNQSLYSLLYNRNYKAFVTKANAEKFHLDDDNGESTYLQYSCKFGLEPFVRVLLDLGADPNKTSPNERRTPLMIAASAGYYNIVQKLVETGNIDYDPVDGNTALHSVLNGIMTCHREVDGPSAEIGGSGKRDFYKCLHYLLNNVSSSQLDLNLPDKKGNTVLHYAFKADDREIIRLLLENGAYIGHKNFNGEMPVKFMSPETLENYLNESITTNGRVLGEEDYEIIFKYNLLAPPKQYIPKNRKSGYSSESAGIADKYEIVSETEPLVAISEISELRPLLKHPLFTTFLNLKWYTIRMYFWINLAFYLIFWSLLTTYILYIYGPITAIVASQNDTVPLDNNTQATELETTRHASWLWCSTLLFTGILLLREFFQFSIAAFRYIKSFENWIEIALIITAYTILLCEVDLTQNRAKLSAVAIFLSWMELVLLIGRHPRVSTYVEMFKVVTLNFLKFLAWYSVLILAFAISFYLLFKDTTDFRFFKTAGLAIFKSAVMITGEYDASNIPFADDIGTSHLLFVLFIFLVSIVLFNLLNGLAVSDTQAIRKDAELVGIICRAKLITYIEKMAISDPFPYLGFLDRLACCCCCIPVRRNSAARNKHFRMFYNRINLFPSLFPDREVRVLVNQDNQVLMKNTKLRRENSDGLSNCYGVNEWRIHKTTIKAAKEVLSQRVVKVDEQSHREVAQAITNLQELYENRLITLESASKRADNRLQMVEDASKRTEQKLNEIMKLLKEKL